MSRHPLLKQMERVLSMTAAGLTLIIFTTGFDLPTFLQSVQSTLDTILSTKSEKPLPPKTYQIFMWLAATTIASAIASRGNTFKVFINNFPRNFIPFGFLLFIIGTMWNFDISEKYRSLFFLLFLDLALVVTVVWAIARHINRIRSWPRDFATNAFLVSVLVGTPMLPVFVQLGLSVILLGIIVGAMTIKRDNAQTENDDTIDPAK